MFAAYRAITVGRMVAVALSSIVEGSNLGRALQGRSTDLASATWALGKVEGVLHGERLYEPAEEGSIQVFGDKGVIKASREKAKRKRREKHAGASKARKVEEKKGLEKPTFTRQTEADEAQVALDIARQMDIVVRVSWWAAEDQDGRVGTFKSAFGLSCILPQASVPGRQSF